MVLDVDTGVDDACALLLAACHPGLELAGVSCVAGNAPVGLVVRNTLRTLTVAGRPDIPVAGGADRPLRGADGPVSRVRTRHGRDGMADLGWADPIASPDPRLAVDLLRDLLVDAADGPPARRITLIALGPLTNLAHLVAASPQVTAGVSRLVLVGGAGTAGRDEELTPGRGANSIAAPAKMPPRADFNLRHDPEAAAVVLACCREQRLPVTMYGLDVFTQVRVSRVDGERLARSGPRHGAAHLAGRLVRHQCDRFGTDAATVGDAGAVCAVLDPGGLRTRPHQVHVGSSDPSRGRTLLGTPTGQGDVEVACGIDGLRYARLWVAAMLGAASSTRAVSREPATSTMGDASTVDDGGRTRR